MITSHHTFSTRIFLNETQAAKLRPMGPAAAEQKAPDEMRDFWWFLRSSPPQSREVSTAQRQRRASDRPASTL